MPASPAMSVPTISPGEMQLLLSRAGLVLNPGQVADLVLAWRQVAGLIAAIPHDRPLADDMALVFRLPPPGRSRRGRAGARRRRRLSPGGNSRRQRRRRRQRPRRRQSEGQGKGEGARPRPTRNAAPRGRRPASAPVAGDDRFRATIPHHRRGRPPDRRKAALAGGAGEAPAGPDRGQGSAN